MFILGVKLLNLIKEIAFLLIDKNIVNLALLVLVNIDVETVSGSEKF